MSVRRCARTADERGFTLVEMVTAIVILGMIMGVIATALTQALSLPSQSSDRAENAARRSLLALQFSNDVANVRSVTPGVTTSQCPVLSPGATKNVSVTKFQWSDPPKDSNDPATFNVTAWYLITYAAYDPARNVDTVEIDRIFTRDGNTTITPVLTGYCVSSPRDVVLSIYDDARGPCFSDNFEWRHERALFQIRETAVDTVSRKVNLEAAVRTTDNGGGNTGCS